MNVFIIRLLGGATVCLCASGCLWGEASEEPQTETYVAEAHLHHEVPAHMPKDFPDAVKQIRERIDELRNKSANGEENSAPERLAELRDIAGWLPDFAADSELNKQEWEQVRDGATRIEIILPTIDGSTKSVSFSDRAVEELETILNGFEKLIQKYPDGFEKAHAHHDHGEEAY